MNPASRLPAQAVRALINRERYALVGRLIKGLVHNLSGGLQMIRLPLDLLEMNLAQGRDADLERKLPAMQQGATRMGEELSSMANKGNDLMRVEPNLFNLWTLVNEQLDFWRADMYHKHEAQVSLDFPQGPGPVLGSYADLAVAFNCLWSNALESIKPRGLTQLGVRGSLEDDRVCLEVWDQGPGPQAELSQDMFNPFVTDKDGEHDGLGLYLAWEVLAACQGGLEWRAEAPSSFVLWLPRQS